MPKGPRGEKRPADVIGNAVKVMRIATGEETRNSTRSNLTRLTNAFSKKFENHEHMVALYALWYNFVRIHKTLRTSPAMAAGIETRLWSMDDVVRLVETREDLRTGALLIG